MIKNFKAAFANLKWYEWVMFSIMIIIGGYYTLTDQTHPMWYLIINYISSIAGVCCIFLCAHASWPNWAFAIINTITYIVILAYNKVYGTMALELLYYMPTNFLGLILWRKHLDTVERDKCKTRIMPWWHRAIMICIVGVSACIYHYILVKVGGNTAWLDSFIVAIGIIATYYEIKRYADQYLLWIITDIIAVVQWYILADPVVLTKKSIYLIMAFIGFYNWVKLNKKRNVKIFNRGFYGGKFLPFHKGHKYCINFAAEQCNELVVILFYNSEEETSIIQSPSTIDKAYLDTEHRIEAIKEYCNEFPNVRFCALNCYEMHKQAIIDGTDTWDAETPYVMKAVGEFQAVYTSEPSYDEYFRRAYPFAKHIVIDYPRVNVPISGTKLRKMDTLKAKKWL